MFNSNIEKLNVEMNKYIVQMKTILPIFDQIDELKDKNKNLEEIKKELGNNSYIFDYVPSVLYHGSVNKLDVINANESTQAGKYVYATDNPIHAFFFSIFRNSSVVKAHIEEFLDNNEEYVVKYVIDERANNALNELISDKTVYINICDGNDFIKPNGSMYINREWISKEGKEVTPLDVIEVNIKDLFNYLEQEGLVEYSKYDKSKDLETIINMFSLNYPYGLTTERGKDISKYDEEYDNFIKTHFPDQFELSIIIRLLIKKIMNEDYIKDNPGMSKEQELGIKLRNIREAVTNILKKNNK